MPLNQEEIKRRIHAARLLRNVSQKDLNRLGAVDGFGNEEMGRVERGELEFRPGKHLDPLCRYLNVPRWWFTADDLNFGSIDAPATVELAAQAAAIARIEDMLLGRAESMLVSGDILTGRLDRLEQALTGAISESVTAETEEWKRLAQELVQGPSKGQTDSPPAPQRTAAARSKRAAKSRTP